jgi:hypothetical protein
MICDFCFCTQTMFTVNSLHNIDQLLGDNAVVLYGMVALDKARESIRSSSPTHNTHNNVH